MKLGNAALRKVARAGAGRRRLQSLILALVTMGSVAAALLAGQLLAGSGSTFDQGFARQNGAHLTVQVDGSKVSAQQIAATRQARGVTALSGPYPTLLAEQVVTTSGFDVPSDLVLAPLTVVGRADPGGPVDDVSLVSGRWANAPGEIVLSNTVLDSARPGATLTFASSPGSPRLTVVGVADSVSATADAWVVPSEVTRLLPAAATPQQELLYRFAETATTAQMTANQAAITATLPSGAVLSAQTYLAVRQASTTGATEIIPPALATFGILGVVMSVIILAGTVGAAVGTGTRRIGIIKALGFTPGQVVRAYCMQALIPCAVGIVLGTSVGTAGATAVLAKAGGTIDGGGRSLTLWVEFAVPLGAAALIGLTALLVSLRAGRLGTIEALTSGRAPKTGRGRRTQRLLAATPLPRHLSLGLAGPFARPARTLALTASIAFGVLAVTLAVGVADSLNRATTDLTGASGASAVQVAPNGENPAPASQQQSDRVAAAIAADPGTAGSYGTANLQMPVSVASGGTNVIVYQGDSSWGHYPLVSGHWLSAGGQAVVPTQFLAATGTRLGDTVLLTYEGRHVPLTLVGEVFDTKQQGLIVMTESQSFSPAVPMGAFQIEVKSGTDVSAYVSRLTRAVESVGATVQASKGGTLAVVVILDAISALMTVLLVVVAGFGVLGAVILDTRERVHDLGVYKAVGMTPRQATGMVLTSVGWLGVIAGAVGVPAGLLLHTVVMRLMGDAIGVTMPSQVLSVYDGPELALLVVGGVAIALIGALGPAGWAGRLRTATALRTE